MNRRLVSRLCVLWIVMLAASSVAVAQVGAGIRNAWQALGGADGPLGASVGGETDVTSSLGTHGRAGEFARGRVLWMADGARANEAFAVYGGIAARYRELGGPSSALGFPITNEANAAPSSKGTVGRYQLFEGGALHWMANGADADHAYETHGAIAELYLSMGASGSWLGFPVSDEHDDRGARRSDFENGFIVWRAAGGARAVATRTRRARRARPRATPPITAGEVGGAIGQAWRAIGAARGRLGAPTSAEVDMASGRGTHARARTFERGQIVWLADGRFAGSAHPLSGPIADKYWLLQGPLSPLGLPIGDEQIAARSPGGTSGLYQRFEGGAIHWIADGPRAHHAFETHGAIAELYDSLGGSGSWLGFPISDEHDDQGARRSDFEHGSIVWTTEGGARAIGR